MIAARGFTVSAVATICVMGALSCVSHPAAARASAARQGRVAIRRLTTSTSPLRAIGDIDGDGKSDLVITDHGVPDGYANDHGGFTVVYTKADPNGSHRQHISVPFISTDVPPIAVADFNGDGYADVAVGVPGANSYSDPDEPADITIPGGVWVWYGGPNGLDPAAKVNLVGPGDSLYYGDGDSDAGGTLVAANFIGDGITDLLVECDDGGAYLLKGATSGLSDANITADKAIQNVHSVAAGDLDGDGMADVFNATTDGFNGRLAGGGNVYETQRGHPKRVHLWGSNRTDAAAIGKINAGRYSDLAVGAPGLSVQGHHGAGVVHVYFGSKNGIEKKQFMTFTLATSGISGAAKTGAHFGASVAIADVNGDGYGDLIIGSPGSKKGAHRGRLTIIYGTKSGLTTDHAQSFTLESAGVPGRAAGGDDTFGAAVTALHSSSLKYASVAVSAPAAGLVDILRGSKHGLGTSHAMKVGSMKPNFGYALAS